MRWVDWNDIDAHREVCIHPISQPLTDIAIESEVTDCAESQSSTSLSFLDMARHASSRTSDFVRRFHSSTPA